MQSKGLLTYLGDVNVGKVELKVFFTFDDARGRAQPMADVIIGSHIQ